MGGGVPRVGEGVLPSGTISIARAQRMARTVVFRARQALQGPCWTPPHTCLVGPSLSNMPPSTIPPSTSPPSTIRPSDHPTIRPSDHQSNLSQTSVKPQSNLSYISVIPQLYLSFRIFEVDIRPFDCISWNIDDFGTCQTLYPHGMVPPGTCTNVHEQYTLVDSRFTVSRSKMLSHALVAA